MAIFRAMCNRPILRKAPLLAAALLAFGCAKNMMRAPEQGVYGTFVAYSPLPESQKQDCSRLMIQADRDTCRKLNSRIIEEPMVGTVRVRNLQTDSTKLVALNDKGGYKVMLRPGSYEVCLADNCSDPLDVSMNKFVPYGGRLPKPADTTGASAGGSPDATPAP